MKRQVWAKIGFFVCLGILLYPVIASLWNQYRSFQVATDYQKTVEQDPAYYKEALQQAKEYNDNLASSTKYVVSTAEYEKDPTYEKLLDIGGMMGYVEIPSISVNEAIYHYSSDDVLQKGIGHIHGSSLPVGGETAHCVLTGHCGLPTQKFFTDLDRVKEGDIFFLHICGETLAYQVSTIQVVLPSNTESLQMEQGKDQVTLVTCTPYGVNSHRLLVTGERIPYQAKTTEDLAHAQRRVTLDKGEIAILGVVLFFLILFLIRRIIERKRENSTGK